MIACPSPGSPNPAPKRAGDRWRIRFALARPRNDTAGVIAALDIAIGFPVCAERDQSDGQPNEATPRCSAHISAFDFLQRI